MAKSRQTRRSGGGKRSKKAYRPGAAAGPRMQKDTEPEASMASTSRTAPAGGVATTPKAVYSGRANPSGSQAAAVATSDFGQEYRYVLGDLRRIAILAAIMFAVLIVLAIILT